MNIYMYNFPASEFETASNILTQYDCSGVSISPIDLTEPSENSVDYPMLIFTAVPEAEGKMLYQMLTYRYPFATVWMVSPSYRIEDIRSAFLNEYKNYVFWSPDLKDFKKAIISIKNEKHQYNNNSQSFYLISKMVSLPLEQQLVTDRILSSITDINGNMVSYYYSLLFKQPDLQNSIFRLCVIRMILPLHLYLRTDFESVQDILINQLKLHMETVKNIAHTPFMIRSIIKNNQLICLFYKKPDKRTDFEKELQSFLIKVKERLESYIGISVLAGYSKTYSSIIETPNHYRRIVNNLDQGNFVSQTISMLDEDNNYLSFSKDIDEYIKKNLRMAIASQSSEIIFEALIEACSKFMKQKVMASIAKMLLFQALIKFSQETDFYLLVNNNFIESQLYSIIKAIPTFPMLQELFALISDIYTQARNNYERDDTNRLELAMAYIQKNYCNKISLASISGYLALTPNYFCGWFKKQTGENFGNLVIKYRIDAAKSLLAHSSKKICNIASEVGYDEIVSFNRAFKRNVGMSPEQYRTLMSNKISNVSVQKD